MKEELPVTVDRSRVADRKGPCTDIPKDLSKLHPPPLLGRSYLLMFTEHPKMTPPAEDRDFIPEPVGTLHIHTVTWGFFYKMGNQSLTLKQ